jgi:hypothetical protein
LLTIPLSKSPYDPGRGSMVLSISWQASRGRSDCFVSRDIDSEKAPSDGYHRDTRSQGTKVVLHTVSDCTVPYDFLFRRLIG